jgi:hypothetical protein
MRRASKNNGRDSAKEPRHFGKSERMIWPSAQTDFLLLLFILLYLFFSQKKFSFFFSSLCLSVTPWKTCNLDYSLCIPMKTCTWTIKLKDFYSEAPERFFTTELLWGTLEVTSLFDFLGRPPQQSPQGQSSVLHRIRNCKFWLFGGFTERSTGLVPMYIASNNRLVHNAKREKKKYLWNIVAESLWMNLKTWWNDWSNSSKSSLNGSKSDLECNGKYINLGVVRYDHKACILVFQVNAQFFRPLLMFLLSPNDVLLLSWHSIHSSILF